MSTKNFVPRANNEGGIGTETKQWGSVWSKNMYVDGTNVKNKLTTLEQDLETLNNTVVTDSNKLQHITDQYNAIDANAAAAAESEENAAASATAAANSAAQAEEFAEAAAEAATDAATSAAAAAQIVDVGVDPTLTVSDAAADAKVTGTRIAEVKNNFNDYVELSNVHYDTAFVRGSLASGGEVYPNYVWRIVTENVQHNTENIIIKSINTGFLIILDIFTDSTASSVASSTNIFTRNCPYLIPANSYFRFCIRRITEDSSEVADIDFFKRQVNVCSFIDNFLDDETPKLSSYYYDSYTAQYMNRSNDKLSDNANSALSDWIKVKTGDVVCYKLATSSAAYLFALCSCKVFRHDTIIYALAGSGASTYAEGTYTVPQDGYIRYGCVVATLANGYFYVKNALQTESAVRLNALENETRKPIPSYWESAVSVVETRYNTLAKSMSDNVVAFPFITDVHWGNNAKQSPRLLRRLCADLGLTQIVCGGDIETGHENTADAATVIERDFFKDINNTVVATLGNHDNNSDQNADANKIVDNGTLYNTFFRKWEQDVICEGVHNSYYDIPSHKLRIVTLDSGTPRWYKGPGDTTYYAQQLEDSCDLALANIQELPADWSVILVTHIIWGGAPAEDTPSLDTFTTSRIKARILDQEYSAEIIAILAGHLHRDIDGILQSTDETKSILVVGTTTDNYNMSTRWGGPAMTLGTDTEQAFDIFQIDLDNRTIYATRVGAGENRNWSY